MKTLKSKHLRFEDRCVIQEFLNENYSISQIANRLGKHRTTIAKEIILHRFRLNTSNEPCDILKKSPYVCNGCGKRIPCKNMKFTYEANIAQNEYEKTLKESRKILHISKPQIASINETISPLIVHKHHSINQVYIEHPECFPFAKSTFYRYIDMGIVNIKNIDLPRKTKYKLKKEYDYGRHKTDIKAKIGRFYTDFQDYIDLNPEASIVEMDTVIGTQGGKGGKCFLTLLFRKFNLMLIYLLPYKKSIYVTQVFHTLMDKLGDDEYKRLFEIILTDNGTEFSDPESIEISPKTGEKLVSLFYCNPGSSWQKGSIEKNHEYIRYVLPKGTSFASLTQEDCSLLASHINSIPRVSLNNHSPYDSSILFIGKKNMDIFNISKIPYDDINLSIRLLKK